MPLRESHSTQHLFESIEEYGRIIPFCTRRIGIDLFQLMLEMFECFKEVFTVFLVGLTIGLKSNFLFLGRYHRLLSRSVLSFHSRGRLLGVRMPLIPSKLH